MDQDTALHAFASEYGRQCVQVAQALDTGHHSREAIRVAAQGQGHNIHLGQLRAQHTRMLEAKHKAQFAGNLTYTIVKRAVEIKHAIEEEWQITVPVVAGQEAN